MAGAFVVTLITLPSMCNGRVQCSGSTERRLCAAAQRGALVAQETTAVSTADLLGSCVTGRLLEIRLGAVHAQGAAALVDPEEQVGVGPVAVDHGQLLTAKGCDTGQVDVVVPVGGDLGAGRELTTSTGRGGDVSLDHLTGESGGRTRG